MGDRAHGACGQLIRRTRIAHIAHSGGDAATTGELPKPLCGRHCRRPMRDRTSPGRKHGHAVSTRASELVHQRPGPRPHRYARDLPNPSADWPLMPPLKLVLDEGHQSGLTHSVSRRAPPFGSRPGARPRRAGTRASGATRASTVFPDTLFDPLLADRAPGCDAGRDRGEKCGLGPCAGAEGARCPAPANGGRRPPAAWLGTGRGPSTAGADV